MRLVRLALAADPVAVTVEVVRIWVRHVPQDTEVAVTDVGAIQVRRWRRDTDVGI
jgi:hypothetical protein